MIGFSIFLSALALMFSLMAFVESRRTSVKVSGHDGTLDVHHEVMNEHNKSLATILEAQKSTNTALELGLDSTKLILSMVDRHSKILNELRGSEDE